MPKKSTDTQLKWEINERSRETAEEIANLLLKSAQIYASSGKLKARILYGIGLL